MNNKRHDIRGNQSEGSFKRGGWQVVYSGFILIMLCFFIMLCSFSTIEEAKVLRFVKSFSNAVNILSGGLKFTEGSEVLLPGLDMVDKRNPLADLLQRLEEIIRKVGFSQSEVTFSMSESGLSMRLASQVLFRVGEAELSGQALPLLEKIGLLIEKTDYSVRIEGHTDNTPIHTEHFPSNWELSTARAVTVLRYFLETRDIPAGRLSAVGFGEYQPLYPNDNEENRSGNRRVEIVFVDGPKMRGGMDEVTDGAQGEDSERRRESGRRRELADDL